MIVDLNLSEEQQLIEDSVRALLSDRLPVDRLRDPGNHQGAAERAAWGALAELGLFGLSAAESDGGLGLGAPEEVLAIRLLGRHLASPSLVAQMLAPRLADDARLRAALVAGEQRAAFANLLCGDEAHLVDAESADRLVLLSAGATLVDAAVASVPVACLDETVALARAGGLGGTERDAEADRASLFLSAYLVGIAQATLDMAVAYAGTREQFGQPIGAFQAVKHQCADMAVRAAASDAQLLHAATTLGSGLVDDRAEIAAARLLATDAALANAKANIQIHGGMGFTAECDAHLFLKRAQLVAVLGSSRRAEQDRLVARAVPATVPVG